MVNAYSIVSWAVACGSLALLAYTWVGYLGLLEFLVRVRRAWQAVHRLSNDVNCDGWPDLTIIVPIHNGEHHIPGKLKNLVCTMAQYPGEAEVIFVLDGCTDGSKDVLEALKPVNARIMILPENVGKSAAQNAAMDIARGEVFVFTDVEARMARDFLVRLIGGMIRADADCASGRAVLRIKEGEVSKGHGLYWRLEQALRRRESELGVLHGAHGWAFAVKRGAVGLLDHDTGDDFVIPLEVILRGGKVIQVEDAVVWDTMPASTKGELQARRRIVRRSALALWRRRKVLNPVCFGSQALAIWSHKVLRWLSPVWLLGIALGSWGLVGAGVKIGEMLIWGQAAVYGASLIGLYAHRTKRRIPVFGAAYSFVLGNIGLALGLWDFLRGVNEGRYGNVDDSRYSVLEEESDGGSARRRYY